MTIRRTKFLAAITGGSAVVAAFVVVTSGAAPDLACGACGSVLPTRRAYTRNCARWCARLASIVSPTRWTVIGLSRTSDAR